MLKLIVQPLLTLRHQNIYRCNHLWPMWPVWSKLPLSFRLKVHKHSWRKSTTVRSVLSHWVPCCTLLQYSFFLINFPSSNLYCYQSIFLTNTQVNHLLMLGLWHPAQHFFSWGFQTTTFLPCYYFSPSWSSRGCSLWLSFLICIIIIWEQILLPCWRS